MKHKPRDECAELCWGEEIDLKLIIDLAIQIYSVVVVERGGYLLRTWRSLNTLDCELTA